jgi:hypothetical protein
MAWRRYSALVKQPVNRRDKPVDKSLNKPADKPRSKASTKRQDKNPHAVALGRAGGLIGGRARWDGVSAEERSAITRAAAAARWSKAKTKK